MNVFPQRTATRQIRRMALVLVVAWAGMVARPVSADIVHLRDGSTLEGTVKRAADGWDVTDAGGKTTHVSSGEVKQLELGPRAGEDPSMGKLASLRNSVEALSDIKQIIERIQRFEEQNRTTPAGKEAEKDLALWRERADKGMVKVGTHWVTVDERAALLEQVFGTVDSARRLIRDGRLKEADALLQQVLAVDPQNVSALYLRGLISFNQDQIQAARQCFDSVVKAVPDCAPALNNLAVIYWRQNQTGPALAQYDAAMTAAPVTREILNNVAEALNALPAEQKNSTVSQRVLRKFTEQDGKLAETLNARGWYRWGATWVTKEQLAKLQDAEKENKAKIDELSKQFDTVQAQVTRADNEIEENNRSLHLMEAESWGRDVNGNLVRLTLPPTYYTIQNDTRRLTQQRQGSITKMDQLRGQAKELQKQFPQPRFTNIQQMIGTEGTPLVPPPATKPATAAVTPSSLSTPTTSP